MPRGRRPSTAALTRLGARKASEMVILTCRTLHFSRVQSCATVVTRPETTSFSHRRPRAMALTRRARRSNCSGRTLLRDELCGSRISRDLLEGGFCQGIVSDRSSWIESERLKLPAPFSRRIAEPFDADATGQATFYCCFDKVGCEKGERETGTFDVLCAELCGIAHATLQPEDWADIALKIADRYGPPADADFEEQFSTLRRNILEQAAAEVDIMAR
jgi:hypothetical protein